jgi:hypothetical protein
MWRLGVGPTATTGRHLAIDERRELPRHLAVDHRYPAPCGPIIRVSQPRRQ